MAAVNFVQSDIFRYLEDSGAGMTKRMNSIVVDPKAAVILNDKLDSTLELFAHTFKEAIVNKALIAIRNGEMILFYAKPEVNLPECLPFFRYTKGTTAKVAVNLTNIVSVTSDDLYNVDDMRRLYAMIIAAYINLKISDPSEYPVKAMEYGAIMWAKMFCKILNSTIGLSTNRDLYAAFFYFAVRFYLTYYIGAPKSTVDSISSSTVRTTEANNYISAIQEYLDEEKDSREARFYGNFTGFCEVLFNNELTNIKALRVAMANPNDGKLTMSFYLKKFIDNYYQSSIMALAGAQYFTWVLLCVQKKAFLVNVKALGAVFNSPTELTKYFASLYTEAESR